VLRGKHARQLGQRSINKPAQLLMPASTAQQRPTPVYVKHEAHHQDAADSSPSACLHLDHSKGGMQHLFYTFS
jgi:hypothetical protein